MKNKKKNIHILHIECRIEINRKYSIATITRCYKFPTNSNHRITQRNIHYRAISLKRSLDFCTSIIISRVSPWRKKIGTRSRTRVKALKIRLERNGLLRHTSGETKITSFFFYITEEGKKKRRKKKKKK